MLDIHAKHGIVAESYGPLTPILRHPGGPLKPVLEKIAKAHNTDTASVLLRWTMQYGVVAVTSSKNEERIKGYSKLWDFELLPAEMKEIEETGRKVHFRHYAVSRVRTRTRRTRADYMAGAHGRRLPSSQPAGWQVGGRSIAR